GRIKGDSGVGAKLHGDRRDPGSYGGPRRLSTPTLPDFHQIRLGRRIHAAHAPAQPTRPAYDSFRARPPRKIKKRKVKIKSGSLRLHPRVAWMCIDQG
ncbi:MAG: hypothetical protein WBH11_18865, partial [Stenotrophomonas geniculata]